MRIIKEFFLLNVEILISVLLHSSSKAPLKWWFENPDPTFADAQRGKLNRVTFRWKSITSKHFSKILIFIFQWLISKNLLDAWIHWIHWNYPYNFGNHFNMIEHSSIQQIFFDILSILIVFFIENLNFNVYLVNNKETSPGSFLSFL